MGVISVILCACATVQPSPQLTTLEQLATIMQGQFGPAQPSGDEAFFDSRQRIVAPDIGPVVFYLQLNRGPQRELYRQRVLVLTSEAGEIVQRAYRLKHPERFIDATRDDPVLTGLRVEDVELMFEPGCEQRWEKRGAEFFGYTDPATCRIISSRTGLPRRIEASTRLSQDTLWLAERGFDDQMRQLFGTEAGRSLQLYRIGP